MTSAPSVQPMSPFHAGDPTHFRTLVEQHGAAVRSVAVSFASDEDDLKDLCQDIWLKVYVKRRSFTGSGPLLAWILTLARRTCISRARRYGTRARAVSALASESGTDGRASSATPLADLEAQQTEQKIRGALGTLSERQRTAVVLRLYDGYDSREAGDIMGCRPATVRSLLRLGLANLRQLLKDLR